MRHLFVRVRCQHRYKHLPFDLRRIDAFNFCLLNTLLRPNFTKGRICTSQCSECAISTGIIAALIVTPDMACTHIKERFPLRLSIGTWHIYGLPLKESALRTQYCSV